MECEFDPAKARSNLRKHGVSFAHAEQTSRDAMAFTMEDPDAIGELRPITLGMDALGRILVAVHTQRDERTRVISARKPLLKNRSNTMRNEYDFSKAKRGAVIASPSKTRITIMLDDDVIETFRTRADAEGAGYQTLINAVLRESISDTRQKPITAATLRRILREELHAA